MASDFGKRMKRWILFHWQRLTEWFHRVEWLQRKLIDKEAEIARLQGAIATLRSELALTQERANTAQTLLVKAERNSHLLANWIKRTHRLGSPTADGTIKGILQHAQNRV